jgi:ATP-dependent exoDNAse (exonuclease V) beta subunit
MIEIASTELDDRAAREEALDTRRSILVQAPAGSGKTELLAMRFLKLLAEVGEPDEILAITFTRYATAEMRHRILAKLETARSFAETGLAPEGEDLGPLRIAAAALANSDRRGWRLLEQPQRLNIQSIDALCSRLARQSPLSGKPGGTLEPTLVAAPLYRKAARRTFDRLGGGDGELNVALRELLLLRDSHLERCEQLLAAMLATRDQWTRAFPLSGEIDWEQARARLEAPFQREIHRVLGEAHRLLSSDASLARELLELVRYACGNVDLDHEIRLLAGQSALPSPSLGFVEHWQCLCKLLLTEANQPRKAFDKRNGFPTHGKQQKQRIKDLVQELSAVPGLVEVLGEIRGLPPPRYSEPQWTSLRHILVALRHAVEELGRVFAEEGMVDIMEVSIAALSALRGEESASAGVRGLRHLLVDEFQDTSRRQHELIAALLRDWGAPTEEDSPRTFFLVGDPMQSIYMFRQADVELFDLVRRGGLATDGGTLAAKPLRLSMNFRSNAGVVKPLNAMFEAVFPHGAKEGSAAVAFLPGVPGDPSEPPGAYEVHASFAVAKAKATEGGEPSADFKAAEAEAHSRETDEILGILLRHQPRIAEARAQGKEFTVAVLARAKNHLVPIAEALRAVGIPFRAVELETLGQRQEILDLRSLTRALLHPMDRIAWLALLRAPWCGLELADLHRLCGTDAPHSAGRSVSEQIEEGLSRLREEAKTRTARVLSVLKAANGNRLRQSSFSSWIERTWISLGGPACVDAAGYQNARSYFRMLEEVAPDGIAANGEAMEEQLGRLFASPDPAVGDRCGVQLMTMHKAKGLGFNVVVLPALHRATGRQTPTLLRYLERATAEGTELLAAPIDNAADETSPLNRWVRRQTENRETEERKRLLYVACTRAREELHLFATATLAKEGLACPRGSLLRSAWPALEEVFRRKYEETQRAGSEAVAGNVVAWPSAPEKGQAVAGVLDLAAAAGAGSALPRSTLLRLPLEYISTAHRSEMSANVAWKPSRAAVEASAEIVGERPQGSRASRILGTVVHALFEIAARRFEQGASAAALRAGLPGLQSQAAAIARNAGLSSAEAQSAARKAIEALEAAFDDAQGLWILKPRGEARAEASWTGIVAGVARESRMDRIFRAGAEPLGEGDCLWIVDYKTAERGPGGLDAFLAEERAKYARQLQGYAEILRQAHGEVTQIRLALYYPLVRRLDWWPG